MKTIASSAGRSTVTEPDPHHQYVERRITQLQALIAQIELSASSAPEAGPVLLLLRQDLEKQRALHQTLTSALHPEDLAEPAATDVRPFGLRALRQALRRFTGAAATGTEPPSEPERAAPPR